MHFIGRGAKTAASGRAVQVVLSFSGKADGWEVAKALKDTLMRLASWDTLAIYLDSDSLVGKPGTKEVTLEERSGSPGVQAEHAGRQAGSKNKTTVQLHPEWATFYRAALDEAPAGVFLLSEGWCNSPFCTEELIWYLALRCGLTPTESMCTTPEALIEMVTQLSREELETMRSGAFFVLLDESARESEVGTLHTKHY